MGTLIAVSLVGPAALDSGLLASRLTSTVYGRRIAGVTACGSFCYGTLD